VILAAGFAAALGVGAPALACSVLGTNTHIGPVTAVDSGKGTFTIIDAETRQPITFLADADVLKSLKDTKGQVRVMYEEADGGKLKATRVDR
jgi:hypothetical protein